MVDYRGKIMMTPAAVAVKPEPGVAPPDQAAQPQGGPQGGRDVKQQSLSVALAERQRRTAAGAATMSQPSRQLRRRVQLMPAEQAAAGSAATAAGAATCAAASDTATSSSCQAQLGKGNDNTAPGKGAQLGKGNDNTTLAKGPQLGNGNDGAAPGKGAQLGKGNSNEGKDSAKIDRRPGRGKGVHLSDLQSPSPGTSPSQDRAPQPDNSSEPRAGDAEAVGAGAFKLVVPRQPDGTACSADLQKAIVSAHDGLDKAHRAMLYARMKRKTESKECPPLLAEKWKQAAGSINATARYHPDFPDDLTMVEYKRHLSTKETYTYIKEHTQTIHWTGALSGQVALEMARNLESLFDQTTTGMATLGRGRTSRTSVGNVSTTPEDYVQKWGALTKTYTDIISEVTFKIKAKPFQDAFCEQLQMLQTDLSASKESFMGLVSDASNAKLLNSTIETFRERAKRAVDHIATADDMLRIKKRKLPSEPEPPKDPTKSEAPSEQPAAQPAAETAAGAGQEQEAVREIERAVRDIAQSNESEESPEAGARLPGAPRDAAVAHPAAASAPQVLGSYLRRAASPLRQAEAAQVLGSYPRRAASPLRHAEATQAADELKADVGASAAQVFRSSSKAFDDACDKAAAFAAPAAPAAAVGVAAAAAGIAAAGADPSAAPPAQLAPAAGAGIDAPSAPQQGLRPAARADAEAAAPEAMAPPAGAGAAAAADAGAAQVPSHTVRYRCPACGELVASLEEALHHCRSPSAAAPAAPAAPAAAPAARPSAPAAVPAAAEGDAAAAGGETAAGAGNLREGVFLQMPWLTAEAAHVEWAGCEGNKSEWWAQRGQ
ncbi:unnamed protein product [Prorocentrum cordatum]|uniref:Uncharacterized protein n=1 Tax=Prorocentrum cordatum TaxID=2364126 RepID=A0ABN9X2Y0_9DINO|nr:unnamed protein product [Polarella glacialis]